MCEVARPREEDEALGQDGARGLGDLRIEIAAREPVDEAVAVDDGQPDAPVQLGVADDGLRLAAPLDRLGLLEQSAAHHDDAAIALAEVLAGAIGDGALADPGDEVLVHDVARHPAPGERILDRAVPAGDGSLLEGLHLVRHAPLEVASGEEAVRPETGPPHGPQLARLRLALEDPAIDEAELELVEGDLEMGRRP